MGRHRRDDPSPSTTAVTRAVTSSAEAAGSTAVDGAASVVGAVGRAPFAPGRTLRTDVERDRERRRRRRVRRLALWLTVPAAAYAAWVATGHDVVPSMPQIDPIYLMTGVFFLAMTAVTLGSYGFAGRSPHLVYRPEQLDVRFEDVKGLAAVTEDVRRSLELFLSARTYRSEMGGTPRRGLLFEGPPGTGKTYMAKAMAAEAGVPFLFVSATSFQSMFYGATSRKIRAYFTALRKAARAEGGAIGFIEEIDAIAMTRNGVTSPSAAPTAGWIGATCGGLIGLPTLGLTAPGSRQHAEALQRNGFVAQRHPSMTSDGVGGVVNELLVQLQSFDTPTLGERMRSGVVDAVNLLLPTGRRIPRPRTQAPDILLIAATNRADGLDPALLRPGRFDRRLVFDAPDKAGRRELVDHFLTRKSHDTDLDDPERRDALAGITQGYTPVMIEHLLDEALVNAVRRGAPAMSWTDLEHARLVNEIGLGQPVAYTEHEKRLIATHEAGHATLAWLVAPHRRLEVLTIVKRAGALGMLAHGDREDVYTRSRGELESLICIAFGGQVAEQVFFGDVSTGPGGDLAYATNVAAQMVGQSGMAGTLVSFSAVRGSAFNDAGLVGRVLADEQGRRMVEALLRTQKERADELLRAHRHLVEALRDALLERHELIGREITDVLEDAAERAAHQAARTQVPRSRAAGVRSADIPLPAPIPIPVPVPVSVPVPAPTAAPAPAPVVDDPPRVVDVREPRWWTVGEGRDVRHTQQEKADPTA